MTYSPKAKYRISCAAEAMETAQAKLEEAAKWLDLQDMTNTQDVMTLRDRIELTIFDLAITKDSALDLV